MDPQELRLQKLESIVPVIQQRINAYDDASSRIESVYEESKKLVAGVKFMLSSSQEDTKQGLELIYKSLFDKIEAGDQGLSNRVASAVSNDEEHSVRINQYGVLITETQQHFDRICDVVKSLSQKLDLYATKQSVDHIKSELSVFNSRQEVDRLDAQQKYTSNVHAIEMIKIYLQDVKSLLQIHENGISDLSNKRYVNPEDLEVIRQEFEIKLANALGGITEGLRREFVVPPQKPFPLAQIQADIAAAIEPISMDSRNASLRSENAEKKIALMEKRIEQQALLIQKLQLAK